MGSDQQRLLWVRLIVCGAVLLCNGGAAVADLVPERRKDQFPPNSAYLAVPLPWSYPGVGGSLFLMGTVTKVVLL